MTTSTSILTHGDLDGLVYGIFLLTALGPDTPFRIANGDTLARDLEHLSMDAPSAIYIADIPLVATRKTTVADAVADLHACGSALHLYDHHLGWDAGRDENNSTLRSLRSLPTRHVEYRTAAPFSHGVANTGAFSYIHNVVEFELAADEEAVAPATSLTYTTLRLVFDNQS